MSTLIINAAQCMRCGEPSAYGCNCHVANEAPQRGACSLADGCGLNPPEYPTGDHTMTTTNQADALSASREAAEASIRTRHALGTKHSLRALGSARDEDHGSAVEGHTRALQAHLKAAQQAEEDGDGGEASRHKKAAHFHQEAMSAHAIEGVLSSGEDDDGPARNSLVDDSPLPIPARLVFHTKAEGSNADIVGGDERLRAGRDGDIDHQGLDRVAESDPEIETRPGEAPSGYTLDDLDAVAEANRQRMQQGSRRVHTAPREGVAGYDGVESGEYPDTTGTPPPNWRRDRTARLSRTAPTTDYPDSDNDSYSPPLRREPQPARNTFLGNSASDALLASGTFSDYGVVADELEVLANARAAPRPAIDYDELRDMLGLPRGGGGGGTGRQFVTNEQVVNAALSGTYSDHNLPIPWGQDDMNRLNAEERAAQRRRR